MAHRSITSSSHGNHTASASGTVSKKYRKITLDMVLASTSLTRSSKETHETYLARVTHLHLQNKRIRVIENLDLCTNLKVLYLYDNAIESIHGLEFANILQYLYLQNNQVHEIPHLQMPSLRKIYLDQNEIKVVTGLTACENLEEFHISRQRLPSFCTLQFDQQSLNCVARSLLVLEISGNGISNLTQFTVLYNLRRLYCKDNAVVDLSEVEAVISLPNLEEANFVGNPCCTLFKYRDTAIAASSDHFNKLDDVAVPKHQQIAIKGLMAHRVKIGAVSRGFHPNQSSSSSYQPKDLGSIDEPSQVEA